MKKLVLILFIFISYQGIAQNKKSILKKITIDYTGWQDKKLRELILSVKCNKFDTKNCYCNCFSISKKSMKEIDNLNFNSKTNSLKLTISEVNLIEGAIIIRNVFKILKMNKEDIGLIYNVDIYRSTLDSHIVFDRSIPDGFFITKENPEKVYYKNWHLDKEKIYYFDVRQNKLVCFNRYSPEPNKKTVHYQYFEDMEGNVIMDTAFAHYEKYWK